MRRKRTNSQPPTIAFSFTSTRRLEIWAALVARLRTIGVVGLPLFESMELLGRDRVLACLDAASKKLAAQA
ncbi:hypothetical protein [Streptomyces crystallinus]|uniref:hypothetical protein n=1 Tax=Streptomyces crystallinus TaxID=68191 RepID=UPI003CD0B731